MDGPDEAALDVELLADDGSDEESEVPQSSGTSVARYITSKMSFVRLKFIYVQNIGVLQLLLQHCCQHSTLIRHCWMNIF